MSLFLLVIVYQINTVDGILVDQTK